MVNEPFCMAILNNLNKKATNYEWICNCGLNTISHWVNTDVQTGIVPFGSFWSDWDFLLPLNFYRRTSFLDHHLAVFFAAFLGWNDLQNPAKTHCFTSPKTLRNPHDLSRFFDSRVSSEPPDFSNIGLKTWHVHIVWIYAGCYHVTNTYQKTSKKHIQKHHLVVKARVQTVSRCFWIQRPSDFWFRLPRTLPWATTWTISDQLGTTGWVKQQSPCDRNRLLGVVLKNHLCNRL